MRNHIQVRILLAKNHTRAKDAINHLIMHQIYHDTNWQFTKRNIRTRAINAIKYSIKCVIWKRIKVSFTTVFGRKFVNCVVNVIKMHHFSNGICLHIQVCALNFWTSHQFLHIFFLFRWTTISMWSMHGNVYTNMWFDKASEIGTWRYSSVRMSSM